MYKVYTLGVSLWSLMSGRAENPHKILIFVGNLETDFASALNALGPLDRGSACSWYRRKLSYYTISIDSRYDTLYDA